MIIFNKHQLKVFERLFSALMRTATGRRFSASNIREMVATCCNCNSYNHLCRLVADGPVKVSKGLESPGMNKLLSILKTKHKIVLNEQQEIELDEFMTVYQLDMIPSIEISQEYFLSDFGMIKTGDLVEKANEYKTCLALLCESVDDIDYEFSDNKLDFRRDDCYTIKYPEAFLNEYLHKQFSYEHGFSVCDFKYWKEGRAAHISRLEARVNHIHLLQKLERLRMSGAGIEFMALDAHCIKDYGRKIRDAFSDAFGDNYVVGVWRVARQCPNDLLDWTTNIGVANQTVLIQVHCNNKWFYLGECNAETINLLSVNGDLPEELEFEHACNNISLAHSRFADEIINHCDEEYGSFDRFVRACESSTKTSITLLNGLKTTICNEQVNSLFFSILTKEVNYSGYGCSHTSPDISERTELPWVSDSSVLVYDPDNLDCQPQDLMVVDLNAENSPGIQWRYAVSGAIDESGPRRYFCCDTIG